MSLGPAISSESGSGEIHFCNSSRIQQVGLRETLGIPVTRNMIHHVASVRNGDSFPEYTKDCTVMRQLLARFYRLIQHSSKDGKDNACTRRALGRQPLMVVVIELHLSCYSQRSQLPSIGDSQGLEDVGLIDSRVWTKVFHVVPRRVRMKWKS